MDDFINTAQYYVLPGKAIYSQIPTNQIREFCDSLFPDLAKNKIADSASGLYHRWKYGHDILIDVPNTIKNKGTKEGIKQLGHIFLTDFPTKSGIPIPFFSKNGLGELLQTLGISPKWMCLNLMDSVLGVLCVTEGSFDLISAFSGHLEMNFQTFCDTFGEGALELTGAFLEKNPLLLVSGTENIIAGIVSTWETYTIHISPIQFFGASFLSMGIGFLTSKYICKNDLNDSLKNALKSGVIGGLFQLSSYFGYGAIVGMAFCNYAKYLAERDSKEIAKEVSVDKYCNEKFLEILYKYDPYIAKLVEEDDIIIKNDIKNSLNTANKQIENDMDIFYNIIGGTNNKLKNQNIFDENEDFLVNYLNNI